MYRLAVLIDSHVIGGAEKIAQHLLHELSESVEVTLVGPSAAVLAEVARRRPSCGQLVCSGSVRSWVAALRVARPDVVHANLSSFTNCRAGIVAALLLRHRVVAVDHAPMPGLRARGRLVQRLMTSLLAQRLAVSRQSARDVEQFGGLRAGAVSYVNNGVPSSDKPPHPSKPGKPPLLGFMGRLESVKGVDVLLRALAMIPEGRLLVAGDGSADGQLRCLAKTLGVDERVDFLGWVDAADFLERIDVLVQPSHKEAMPLTILEAMHAGIPVVATAVGAVPDVLAHGHADLLVAPGDADALAIACRALLDSPPLRETLSVWGRERAMSQYSVRRMADDYDDVYQRVRRPARAS